MTQRNNYTKEFKLEAIALVNDQNYSCAEAGRALGINGTNIARWCREHESGKSGFQGHGRLTPDQQRIRDLEKQVRRLEMEKSILKKATAFFARDL
jgi:transposase